MGTSVRMLDATYGHLAPHPATADVVVAQGVAAARRVLVCPPSRVLGFTGTVGVGVGFDRSSAWRSWFDVTDWAPRAESDMDMFNPLA
jgi:hypothetical protein